jgi:hypothetical protein
MQAISSRCTSATVLDHEHEIGCFGRVAGAVEYGMLTATNLPLLPIEPPFMGLSRLASSYCYVQASMLIEGGHDDSDFSIRNSCFFIFRRQL